MAKEYPLTIDSGEGLEFIFYYRQKETQSSLIPAGSTATMELHDVRGGFPELLLTTQSGHIVLDSVAGRAETRITQVQAADLSFNQATYKWYLNRPTGTRKKLFYGPVKRI